MGFFNDIFSRGSRVAKGVVHGGMDSLEDATFEQTVKQAVRDLKEELNKVVKAGAEAMSNTNRLEAEYQKYSNMSDDWKKKAMAALEAGNEELAKKALAKKAEADTEMGKLEGSLTQARAASESLKKKIGDLKRKIHEAERNAGTLIARRNAARAQKKISQAMAGAAESDNAFAAIQSFEEKVNREEAAAKAYEDLAVDPDTELAKEFEALNTASVDDDLAKLKAEMNKG